MYIYFIDIVFNRLQSVLNVDNRSVTLSEMTQQNEFYHSPIDIHKSCSDITSSTL